jgi:hypothetical protein
MENIDWKSRCDTLQGLVEWLDAEHNFEANRLNWVLQNAGGRALCDLLMEMSDMGDLGEFRARIDARIHQDAITTDKEHIHKLAKLLDVAPD